MINMDHRSLNSSFFRGVNSPELFKRFFDKFGAWDALQLEAKPTNDEIFSAWSILEHPKRKDVDENLSRINDISVEEAREWLYLVAEEGHVKGFHDLTLHKLAMVMWLDHPRQFRKAYEYFALEKLDNLKVLVGDEPAPCSPNEDDLLRFQDKLRIALRKQGQGPRLKVEPGPHPAGKWVLVIPHENFKKPDHEFGDDMTIVSRDRRPIYDLVLIYYPEKGLLKVKSGKGDQKAMTVAAVFASEILGKAGTHFRIVSVVKFDPLFDPKFTYQRRPGEDQFEWARPCGIRYRLKSDHSVSGTLQCHDVENGERNVIDQLGAFGLSLNQVEILSFSIQFKFPDAKRKKTRTINLNPPHRYNLDETARDRQIEEVLMRWGFIDIKAKRVSNAA